MNKSLDHGIEREHQIRDIAARLGVADFVYMASPLRKGKAVREASGDGLLVVGVRGAVLQVKAREPDKAKSDSEARATAWIRKHADKARAQGRGTKHELARRRREGVPITVSPIRAASLPFDIRAKYDLSLTQATDDWPIIVVLDHPKGGDIDLEFEPDVVWLTFQDWNALQQQLRSTAGLLEYARRVLTDGIHVPLGREVERYRALSAADVASAANIPGSLPHLAPLEGHDQLGADLFHDVIDKVWPHDGLIPWRSADQYRAIVEFLDVVPPRLQALVGRWFLQKRRELETGQYRASGLVCLNHRDRLVFGCSNLAKWPNSEAWTAEFSALTALRHTQALETGAPKDTTTLGVAALVEAREGVRGVSYFFLMLKGVEGELPLPSDLRKNFEWRYGRHNHTAGTILEVAVGNDDL